MELGNLEMILRLSRWHGIAPYSSLSTLEVCRGYVVYGIVLFLIYSYPFIFIIAREIYAICFDIRPASMGKATGIGIITLSLLLIWQTILKAPRRLTHIKQSILKLNQINMKLNQKKGNGKGKYQCTIICCIVIQFGTRLIDTFGNIDYYMMYFDNVSQIWRYLRIPLILYYTTVNISIFQIFCFINTVLSTLVTINNQLENLRSERRSLCQFYNSLAPRLAWSNCNSDFIASNKQQCTDTFQREEMKKVKCLQSLRELNVHYSVICDIVRESVQLDGVLLCLLVLYFLVYIQLNVFILLFWKVSTKLSYCYNVAVILSFIWIFIHGKNFIIFVEPFHRTFNEMQRTTLLVNSFKAAVIDDESAKNEVETFQHMLILNRATFSPLNMFTINRSLIIKVLGGVLTYVVTWLTYAPEIKSPNSYLNQYFFNNATI